VPREPDDGDLLELVGTLMGLLDLEELRAGVLDALARAVPAKWASLNEIGPDHVVAVAAPNLEPHWSVRFGELGHENPLYQRWVRTRDGRAYRFSDVTTPAKLEATSLYREVYAPLGVRHQIAFTLPEVSGRIVAIALSRGDSDFSDAERDFLNRARPYIIQAYRNAIAHSELAYRSPVVHAAALVEAGLTGREAEVMRLVATGGSNREVASQLGVSPRTVQKHLERSFRKLGAATRAEATARARELSGHGQT
jgi:DNA-binding CsgD family transcriptional regulator